MYQNQEGFITNSQGRFNICKINQSVLSQLQPMDCSLLGSSVHGNSRGKNTGVDCHEATINHLITKLNKYHQNRKP